MSARSHGDHRRARADSEASRRAALHRRVTKTMLALLREVGGADSAPLPYRQGAATTARALLERGLVLRFHSSHGWPYLVLTDAGRRVLARQNLHAGIPGVGPGIVAGRVS